MMSSMKLGLSPGSNVKEFESWFKDNFVLDFMCVQDTVHIGTKMRNRLLNSSIVLYMGNKIASIIHIKMLLERESKEVHGLVWSDIAPEDRQNFSSLEKLMQPRVIDSLEKNIADCRGTVMYLKLCKQITSSFLDDSLDHVERIYRIWNSLYFLRIWRAWISSKENEHTLAENFVSRNMFLCVEINAHALVYLMRILRDNQQADLFIPSKFASQPCEYIFRQMRSTGTTNFTKINFTLYELQHMVSRVELLNKLAHSRNEIRFPRIESKKLKEIRDVVLPNDQQIFDAMNKAFRDALENSAAFGMDSQENVIKNFDVSLLTTLIGDRDTDQRYSSDASSEDYEPYDDVNVIEQLFNVEANTSNPKMCMNPGVSQPETPVNIQLDTLNQDSESPAATNPGVNHEKNKNFVEIINPDGTLTNVRKSTIVWKLLENNGKLSSDRLKRVQGSSEPKRKKQKTTEPSKEDKIVFKTTEIAVG